MGHLLQANERLFGASWFDANSFEFGREIQLGFKLVAGLIASLIHIVAAHSFNLKMRVFKVRARDNDNLGRYTRFEHS